VTAPNDWWRGFFDRDYLHAYGTRFTDEGSREEALAAVALAGAGPGARVLDAPCGFGRHSIPLAEAGYNVVGVDYAPEQVAEARARAGARPNPEFVEGDIRDLPFAAAAFDCALNLFTSIGYLGEEGDLDVLREFHRVLKPGSALVLETMHRDRFVQILRERDWEHLPGSDVVLEERTFDAVAGVIEGTHRVVRGGSPGTERQYRLRVYTATELVRLLDQAGFDSIECHGGLAGETLTRDTRLVVVARASRP
jgi:SAM-dependent methyltransferase